MKFIILSITFCLSFFSISQIVDYDDVAVIINDNSQTSIDIGNYFQSARSIPNQNMIHVTGPITEDIDLSEFELIRGQIENHLLSNNMADSINYLVTTKGVPLKVGGSCFDSVQGGLSCTSFDSELCLILSQDSIFIGNNGSVANPVCNDTQHFSREASGIYLVTRLTGYTKQDVFNLIDRSGPQTGLNQSSAQAVLDLNNALGPDSTFLHDQFITPTNDYLVANSWNSQVDLNFSPLSNETNVFAYLSYGVTPSYNAALNHGWTEGSIAVMTSPFSANTFDSTQNASGQLFIADLISEGCTGGHAVVNGNFYSLILQSSIFFDRYLNTTEDYNLAESFYMADQRLSWQSVVVGDPKSSAVIDNTAGIEEPEELTLRMHPNPTQGNVRIESDQLISSIRLYAINGALVKSIDVFDKQVDLDLFDLNGGVYLAHVFAEGSMKVERIVLTK